MYLVFTYCVVDLHVHSIDLDAFLKKNPSGTVPSVIRATAVTWLNYCRYGVKLYPINQSINIRAKKA